jgi:hypothetical protein
MQDKLDSVCGKLFLINAAMAQDETYFSDVVSRMLTEVVDDLNQVKRQKPESKQPTKVELPIDLLKKASPIDIVLNVLDLLHVIEFAVETPESREHLFGPLSMAREQLYLVRDALEGK